MWFEMCGVIYADGKISRFGGRRVFLFDSSHTRRLTVYGLQRMT